jgi:hypothetical protein
MKWYLKVHDRPIGIETNLFTSYNKPETPREVYNRLVASGVSTDEADSNPFGWTILEFDKLGDVLEYCINNMSKDNFIEFILNSWPNFIWEKHE